MGCIQGSGPGSRAQNPYFGPYLAQKGPIYLDRKVDLGSGPCTGASWARGWGPLFWAIFGPYSDPLLEPSWPVPVQKGLKSLYVSMDMALVPANRGSEPLSEWPKKGSKMTSFWATFWATFWAILTPVLSHYWELLANYIGSHHVYGPCTCQ